MPDDVCVTVCAPAPVAEESGRAWCPRCRKNRTFQVKLFEWFDPLWICRKCGAQFNGGPPAPHKVVAKVMAKHRGEGVRRRR